MEKVGLVKKVKVSKEKVFKVIMTKKGKDRYQSVTRDSIEMVFSSLSAVDKRKLRFVFKSVAEKGTWLARFRL